MVRFLKHLPTKTDYSRARSLRNDPSPFEQKLWVVLREQAKLHHLKFRRQQVIHPYIVDFACMQARLVVELDGTSHDTRLVYDKVRDGALRQAGFTVLRFRNEDVVESLEYVVNVIINRAVGLVEGGESLPCGTPLPNPPLKGEGTVPVLWQGDFSMDENRCGL